MDSAKKADCLVCAAHSCDLPDMKFPAFCVAQGRKNADTEDTLKEYFNNPEVLQIARAAAEVEGQYYGKLTRVEEIIAFAKKIGAKKIGIATCMGLVKEAGIFQKVLEAQGLQSSGVACKAGSVDKTELGIPPEYKVKKGSFEAICNPILQARLLEKEQTDLNVIIGLCVGHDTLFMRYSHAPVTVLLTKDRVLGHNPAAALYNSSSYYKKLFSRTDF